MYMYNVQCMGAYIVHQSCMLWYM